MAGRDEHRHVRQQDELSLWREGGFRFVEQQQPGVNPVVKNREKRLAVRAGMERAAAVARVRVAANEVGVFPALVQERREMRLKLRAQEIRIVRAALERRT